MTTKRYAYIDNAKVLFIFLVVFGHLIQPFTSKTTGISAIYTWIYTFHMPAFILLSGFFAKGMHSLRDVWKLFKQLIVPYLIFQIAYSGYYFWIGKNNWTTDNMFVPHWSLWFLLSLFSWHLLLTVFRRFPAYVGLPIAVVIGLVVGYNADIGHAFSLSRTFVFFPFFLAGYFLTKEHFDKLQRPLVRIGAIFILIIAFFFIYYGPEIDTGWLLASKSYETLGASETGALWRLVVYSVATIMTMSVLALIPTKEWRGTVLGERTLYVYLLHGFFIQYARANDFFTVDATIDLFALALIAAILVLVLSSQPVRMLTQPMIELRTTLWKNREANQN